MVFRGLESDGEAQTGSEPSIALKAIQWFGDVSGRRFGMLAGAMGKVC